MASRPLSKTSLQRGLKAAAVLLCAAIALPAQASSELKFKPGLWRHQTRIWINDRELGPAAARLNEKIREKLTEAQRAQLDRTQTAEQLQCVGTAGASINLPDMAARMMGGNGIWHCALEHPRWQPNQLDAGLHCTTTPGGQHHSRIQAVFTEVSLTLSLEGHGNAVNGLDGTVLPVPEVRQRLLSTHQWAGACPG